MTIPLQALDSALIATLENRIALDALIGENLFNGIVPATKAGNYPRVTIGDASDRDAIGTEGATFNKTTRSVSENIHIWTRKGRHEMLLIYSEIYSALHRKKLALSSGQMLSSGSVQLVIDMVDPDGVTTHGIARFSSQVI
jgi:hypothetical protein